MRGYFATWSRTGLTRQVTVLAAPLILQNLSHTLLGVADTYFVAQVGTTALAAVGLAVILFFAVLVLFRGVANSTVIFVGRAYGAEDDAEIGAAVWRGLSVVALLSLLLPALPFLFAWFFSLAAPAGEEELRALGTSYLQIRSFEVPLFMFGAVVWGFMVGRGDSRTPMLLAWFTVLLNIFLDWLLVLGNLGFPMLGVAGAAYATLLAMTANAVVGAVLLWRAPHRRRYGTAKARLASWGEIRRVLAVGLPMGLGDFILVAAFTVFFSLLARLGEETLAATQIAMQYLSLSFTAGFAVAMASSSLVARYLGAGKPAQAERVGYRASGLAMLLMGSVGVSYLIAPEALIGVFSRDEDVILAGTTILRLVALYQVIDGLGIVLGGSLNGAGDTRFTMLARAFCAAVIFLPLAWLLAFPLNGGVLGAWLGAIAYLFSLTLLYLWRWRSGRWKHLKV
jgi:multidrug resistance protein, MATE family